MPNIVVEALDLGVITEQTLLFLSVGVPENYEFSFFWLRFELLLKGLLHEICHFHILLAHMEFIIVDVDFLAYT